MLTLTDATRVFTAGEKTVAAVQGVSLSVHPRELVCIQGPSGCGKTTLLLMCGALLRPSTGNVRISEADPYALSPNDRSAFRGRHIGFIFQQFHLVPYLTALQNVLAADLPTPRPGADERAWELVRHFGLEPRAHHVPSELSVGERQRVAMARALFNEPKLLLADEPTGNLDPRNAAAVLDALREYAGQGGAVLVVTHDPGAAERANRVLTMEAGRLVDRSLLALGQDLPFVNISGEAAVSRRRLVGPTPRTIP